MSDKIDLFIRRALVQKFPDYPQEKVTDDFFIDDKEGQTQVKKAFDDISTDEPGEYADPLKEHHRTREKRKKVFYHYFTEQEDHQDENQSTKGPPDQETDVTRLKKKELLNILAQSDADLTSTTTPIDIKYKMLNRLLIKWVTEPPTKFDLGESDSLSSREAQVSRHFLLTGSPGIGKTYEVLKILKEHTHPFWRDKIHYQKSGTGDSVSNLIALIAKFRNNLIILDDCDDLLRSNNPTIANILKGIFDPSGPYLSVFGSQQMKNLAKANYKDLRQVSILEKKKNLKSFLIDNNPRMLKEALIDHDEFMNYLNSYMQKKMDSEDDDTNIEYDDITGDEFEPDSIEQEEDLDTLFQDRIFFRSKVLFISNIPLDQVNQAVASRVMKYDLTLTSEEILSKIASLKNSLFGSSTPTDEEIFARENAFNFLQLAVEAQGKPFTINGKTITLYYNPGKTALNFRTYQRLAEGCYDLVVIWIKEGEIKSVKELRGDKIVRFLTEYRYIFNNIMSREMISTKAS